MEFNKLYRKRRQMSYFVIVDGLLYSSGNNNYGQLGLNDRDDRKELTQVKNPKRKFISVSNFHEHTMAIDENGYLWSCGDNSYGQLGLNDYNSRWELTLVSTTQKFQAVSCGHCHSAAIDSEGFLWVCGINNCDQLGLNTNEDKISLTKVNNKKFTAVSCASNHKVVIDEDGYLWGCGDNFYGQLGSVCGESIKELTKICEQRFVTVSTLCHTVAIDIEGYLWFCGRNEYGRLYFDSKETNVPGFSKVPNLEQKFIAVNCDYKSTILVDNENRLWCAGNNEYGSLGFGHVNTVFLCINNILTESIIYATLHRGFAFVIDKNGCMWVSGGVKLRPFHGIFLNQSIFTKITLGGNVDILINCSPRKIGLRTKGAHH